MCPIPAKVATIPIAEFDNTSLPRNLYIFRRDPLCTYMADNPARCARNKIKETESKNKQ